MASLSVERIRVRDCKVVVLGLGYVGLPLAVRSTFVGFSTVGYDPNVKKIESLQSGRSYVEDVDDRDLTSALEGTFSVSANSSVLADFDIAVITVPTPLKGGHPDLSFVESAGEVLSQYLQAGKCVILESTSYPGTTDDLLTPILCSGSGLSRSDFFVGYSPERVDPGNSNFSLVNTPKLVAAGDSESLELIAAFYSSMVSEIHRLNSCAEAEMAKLLENTFRHVNIALVNELARYAHELSIDIWNVIEAAATKPFGFLSFTPGPGVGGHCLPIDPSYLSWKVRNNLGRAFRFVDLANDVNDHMPEYVIERAQRLLNRAGKPLQNSQICLLGMSYKAGTGDWRESPSLKVLQGLTAQGADVVVCDPYVRNDEQNFDGRLIPFSTEVLSGTDLCIVLVAHPEFDQQAICKSRTLVLDTRNHLAGWKFEGERL